MGTYYVNPANRGNKTGLSRATGYNTVQEAVSACGTGHNLRICDTDIIYETGPVSLGATIIESDPENHNKPLISFERAALSDLGHCFAYGSFNGVKIKGQKIRVTILKNPETVNACDISCTDLIGVDFTQSITSAITCSCVSDCGYNAAIKVKTAINNCFALNGVDAYLTCIGGAKVINNTFYAPEKVDGYVVYFDGVSNAIFVNNILFANGGTNTGTGTFLHKDYNLYYGMIEYFGSEVHSLYDINPRFIDESFDMRLRVTSPARIVGLSPASLADVPDKDLLGVTRVTGYGTTLGAYETVPKYLTYYNESVVNDGDVVLHYADLNSIIDLIQMVYEDEYFNNPDKVSRVCVYYQNGRESKRIDHGAGGRSPVSWSAVATDGTWQKTRIRVIDKEGAERNIYSENIHPIENLTHSQGKMNLNKGDLS